MAKIIELKEINLKPGEEHIGVNYPGAGFYNVVNHKIFMMVYELNKILYTFPLYTEDAEKMIEQFKDAPEPTATLEQIEVSGTVSEEFTLKALALVLNKEKFSDLNLKETQTKPKD